MWKYTTLEDSAFSTINGLWTGKSEPFVSAKVLRNTNFRNDGVLDYSNVATLDVELKSLSKKRLNKGDIIIERSGGGPKQPVGRVCLFDLDTTEPFSLSNFTTALRIIDSSRFLPRFVCYYLLYLYRTGHTEALQRATTGIRNLDFSAYLRTEIPEPPINEQRTISSILWQIQQAIEVETNLIRVTRELKAAVMKKLFTEGLNGEPQKETEIGMVPESWERTRLVEFVLLQRGFDITKKEQMLGKVPVVSSGGISSYHNTPTVRGPGVVVGRKGSVGTVRYLEEDFWAHDTTLFAKDFFGNHPKFVFYQLTRMDLKKYDSGASNPTLNRNLIQDLPIYVPPISEQIRISNALDSVEAAIENHCRKKELLEELFRSTLSMLMSGTIRLADFDFAASCLDPHGFAA
jgi:type I restriction enzyme S subunit